MGEDCLVAQPVEMLAVGSKFVELEVLGDRASKEFDGLVQKSSREIPARRCQGPIVLQALGFLEEKLYQALKGAAVEI